MLGDGSNPEIIEGLAVRRQGPETAATIVFLHGGGVGCWSWDRVVAQLSSDWHCLIPDLPEHGQSAQAAPLTIEDTAQRVATLIQRQAPDGRASIVGLSLGGQVGLALLGMAPDLVKRAVLSGVLVRPIPARWLIPPLLRLYYPLRNLSPLIRANMRASEVPDTYFTPFSRDTRQMRLGALTRVFTESLSFRTPLGLERVTAPTLVIVGEREPKNVRQSACEIITALPHAEARLATGLGHNWPLTAPDRFAQTVRAWITGQPLPEGLASLEC